MDEVPLLQLMHYYQFCSSVKYTAPEVLASIFNSEYNSGPKVDIWSLGIILVELVFVKNLWPALKLGQYLRKVLSLIYCDDVLSRFARETDSLKVYQVGFQYTFFFLIFDFLSIVFILCVAGHEPSHEKFPGNLFACGPEETSYTRNFTSTQDFRFIRRIDSFRARCVRSVFITYKYFF